MEVGGAEGLVDAAVDPNGVVVAGVEGRGGAVVVVPTFWHR